jgi:HPt (histidine-containing phosphotransfer) domain-containing protein
MEPAMPEQALIDAEVFAELQRTAGSDFVADLVQTFCEEGPTLLAELRAAATAGAAERVRRAAHSLKSNGQTFDATRLAAQARALEQGGLPVADAALQAFDTELRRSLAALQELARG